MGIKDLVSFLKKRDPDIFSTSFSSWQESLTQNTSSTKRLRIAIDVPILAYKLAYISGTDVLVQRILHFALKFKETATPIFVFDGENLVEKTEEKAKRAAAFKKRPLPPVSETRRLFADDEFEIVVELGPPACKQPCKKDYVLMKEALLAAGYECQSAKFEAEALCAYLCSDNVRQADAVLTEDSDAFAYCATNVILRYGSADCIVVESRKMFESLQISPDCFIDLCVLLGNDFNERLHLIGPVKALSLLQKHSNLSQVLEFLEVADEKKQRMLKSRFIFKSFCFEQEV
jgi:5'-3' exonuclease